MTQNPNMIAPIMCKMVNRIEPPTIKLSDKCFDYFAMVDVKLITTNLKNNRSSRYQSVIFTP